jgi:hypothetical protein
MSHTYIDTSSQTALMRLLVKDNLDLIPASPAVYAICGRVNGQTANCRFVGQADNLKAAIEQLFQEDSPHACVGNFMRSIKIKELIYVALPGSTPEEREALKLEWDKIYKPLCNDELNRVY